MNPLHQFINLCVDFDGLGYDQPKRNTIDCAVQTLFDETLSYLPSYKVTPKTFTESLQGLPSYISVPFANYEIVSLMYALGVNFDRSNEDECDKVVEMYWTECGNYLYQVFNNLHVYRAINR